MNILEKLFNRSKAPIPNRNFYYGGITPPDRTGEGFLSAYESIGWLHAVVFRIALGCSEVEWTLFDTSNQDKPKQIFKHPVLTLLHQVNPFQTSNEFIALDTIYNELIGESFWALNFNALGEPAEIILPYPHKMSVVPAANFPFVKGYVYGTGADAIPFDVNEIIHFKYPNPLNQYRGLAPARAIGVNLDAEQNADKWVNQFFYNSARPDGVIQFDYNLSDEQFDKLKKQWQEKYKGVSKAHQVALLEGGGKYIQIQNTIKDMDFANLKQKNRDVILGVFGMPQSVMGISENVNKANAEAGDYTFARWIVKPRLDWKKAKIQEQLIPKFRRSENLQIGFMEVVPETTEQKVAAAESGMRAGYLTVNEARKTQGLDPIPNGDVLLVPLNLIPTPVSGKVVSNIPNVPPDEKSKGGEGSGNFGHEGRPGEVGGSGGGGGGGGKPSSERQRLIDNIKVGRRASDNPKLAIDTLKKTSIPESHLESVKSISVDTGAVQRIGGGAMAFCDRGGRITLAGKVADENLEHEIGHAWFVKNVVTNPSAPDRFFVPKSFNRAKKENKGFVSSYARTDVEEYFAESYAAYAQNPKGLSKVNPEMGKYLKGIWK